ncbi:hypothetical protein ACHQM5_010998 [Ranunculus cassubicifolius]
MAEDHTESLLKLKIINAENLKLLPFPLKTKSFILLWINPLHKQSTKTLTHSTKNPTYNHNLTLPLSLQTLQNPNSHITIQIIAISSPIQHKKVIGSTVMAISDIRFDEEVFTLQLWRPSGRVQGLIRVSARVEINLGVYSSVPVGCVTGVPFQMEESIISPLVMNTMEQGLSQYHNVVPIPSAPVEEQLLGIEGDDQNGTNKTTETKCELQTLDIDIPEKVESDCCSGCRSDCNSSSNCETAPPVTSDGPNVLRSLLVGFLGGAVAVATVLVGSANS